MAARCEGAPGRRAAWAAGAGELLPPAGGFGSAVRSGSVGTGGRRFLEHRHSETRRDIARSHSDSYNITVDF